MSTESYDVVVIGAGVAGVACGIEAARAGASVLLADPEERVGGTASIAGGGTCIAGSDLQRRLGLDDSPDIALEDWLRWGGESVDVEWAHRYLRDSEVMLFSRLAELGVDWVAVQPREGNRVARWHQPRGGGAAVMRSLEREAHNFANLEFRFGHLAVELICAAGSVVGVRLQGSDGDTSTVRVTEVRARAVVVASGGFNNNAEMVAGYAHLPPDVERVLLGGGLGAKGGGHALLDRVGAQFTQLEAVWMYPYGTPDYRNPGSRRGLVVRGIDGEVWINDSGQRFHDESRRGGGTGTAALLAQPRGRCWAVVDAPTAARMTIADPYYREAATSIRSRIEEFLARSPHVRSASSLAELARRTGVDTGNLTASIGSYNDSIRAGLDRDPDFGKPLAGLDPIEAAPFYAIRFHPLARKNLGGVRTDGACRVVDAAGRPIVGLFAAGEVAGMAGGRINGRAALEGTSFGPSFYSGMIAGRSAANS